MKINIDIFKIVFLDIETIGATEQSEDLQKAFEKKVKNENSPEEITITERGGLYPEFGKIVCISVGIFDIKTGLFKTNSYSGKNEKELLLNFLKDYKVLRSLGKFYLCGHNVKEFDVPFIIKRCLINRIYDLPENFQTFGKKPWEHETILDTMEIWKCGSLRGTASLLALCIVFGLPNPKELMDGSGVKDCYDKDDFKSIEIYCEGDVIATARVFAEFQNSQEARDILSK